MTRLMRHVSATAFASFLALGAFAAADSAKADPYRWCAQYGASDDGGTNCYFVTLEQCRAAISGNGGFCVPNNFYNGGPVTTSEDAPRRSRSRAPR
jgi:hypothetical protein